MLFHNSFFKKSKTILKLGVYYKANVSLVHGSVKTNHLSFLQVSIHGFYPARMLGNKGVLSIETNQLFFF